MNVPSCGEASAAARPVMRMYDWLQRSWKPSQARPPLLGGVDRGPELGSRPTPAKQHGWGVPRCRPPMSACTRQPCPPPPPHTHTHNRRRSTDMRLWNGSHLQAGWALGLPRRWHGCSAATPAQRCAAPLRPPHARCGAAAPLPAPPPRLLLLRWKLMAFQLRCRHPAGPPAGRLRRPPPLAVASLTAIGWMQTDFSRRPLQPWVCWALRRPVWGSAAAGAGAMCWSPLGSGGGLRGGRATPLPRAGIACHAGLSAQHQRQNRITHISCLGRGQGEARNEPFCRVRVRLLRRAHAVGRAHALRMVREGIVVQRHTHWSGQQPDQFLNTTSDIPVGRRALQRACQTLPDAACPREGSAGCAGTPASWLCVRWHR